jgi:undecaprenyl-phosphate 4-deoxy-4-formamido-L-arabinose transferase
MNQSRTMPPSEQSPHLSITVPVYRSENCLEPLVAAIDAALAPTGWAYEIILVNDCSPDRSWQVIESLCQRHSHIVGIDLRKNFGQDNALLTGVRFARGKYVAIMDDDLQHDPQDLLALVATMEKERADVVYANFTVKYQKLWKNLGSWFNGKVAEWVLAKPKGIYLSPYKVIRKDVVDLICSYDGPEPYLDGLLFQVTSRITQIPASHHRRHSGSSNYNFWKSFRVWVRLATTFSVKPLRIVSGFGFFFAVLGVLLTFVVVFYRLLFPENFSESVAGWASLMVAVLVVGGIQMFFFGVLGEYVGRTYHRVNNKPQTAIREVLNLVSGEKGG